MTDFGVHILFFIIVTDIWFFITHLVDNFDIFYHSGISKETL